MMVPFVHDNIVDYIPCWLARDLDVSFVPCHVAKSGKPGKRGVAPGESDAPESGSGGDAGD